MDNFDRLFEEIRILKNRIKNLEERLMIPPNQSYPQIQPSYPGVVYPGSVSIPSVWSPNISNAQFGICHTMGSLSIYDSNSMLYNSDNSKA